ncbi:MAG: hypothetical protein KAH44_31950, partial [Oricola sp.]|nr:hypothetical protein [Oricola sp.]
KTPGLRSGAVGPFDRRPQQRHRHVKKGKKKRPPQGRGRKENKQYGRRRREAKKPIHKNHLRPP